MTSSSFTYIASLIGHMRLFVLIVAFGSTLLACGGSAPETETTGIGTTSPLSITATTPQNGSTNVSTSSALTITFSEPVDPATLTTSTVLINPLITGAITVNGTNVMFDPITPFDPSTPYAVTLTTGVKGVAGNALTAPFSWSFTTGTIPDTMPPDVNATSPLNGATNVSTSSALMATFTEPVNPTTVTAATFMLKDGANNPVGGNITTNGAIVTFAPSTPLNFSTTYTATLTTGIKDLSGNAMASFRTWSFTTAAGTSSTFGLEFPTNADVTDGQTVRFKFTSPHLNGLPIYGPGGDGVTYVFKVRPKQQTGYYTTFYWANDDGAGTVVDTFLWKGGPFGAADTYYGMHPYPPGSSSGTTHNWEISIEQNDFQNGTVVKDVWYTQVVRVWSDGNGKHHEFYWNWPNTDAAHKVVHMSPASWGNTNPPAPALTFGDAPWQPGREMCSCTLRGLQIYNSLLPLSDIQAEMDSPLSTQAGANSVWYLNLNPTPSDISDKSGRGHHPAWVGIGRPTLYVGP